MTERWTNGAFVLFARPRASGNGWVNLKLVLEDTNSRKRNWWLGWNGERLARNHCAKHLARHHRETYEWVISTLRNEGAQ